MSASSREDVRPHHTSFRPHAASGVHRPAGANADGAVMTHNRAPLWRIRQSAADGATRMDAQKPWPGAFTRHKTPAAPSRSALISLRPSQRRALQLDL